MRGDPDIFAEDPDTPRRAIAPKTVELHRRDICYAANALIRHGWSVGDITSLAALVELDAFKEILRHFHNKAGQKPNAQAIQIAKTMIDVARYYVRVPDYQLREMKRLATKLPPIPNDLTEKNKELLRKLECEGTKRRLLFLPETLLLECESTLKRGELPFVKAQVSVAVAIQLSTPLRPQ